MLKFSLCDLRNLGTDSMVETSLVDMAGATFLHSLNHSGRYVLVTLIGGDFFRLRACTVGWVSSMDRLFSRVYLTYADV